MFYFYMRPLLIYNWIMILAATIPAIILMIKVYKADRLEKESGRLLRSLVAAGFLSTLLALIEERLGESILSCFVEKNSLLYQIILYFVIVAIAEESSKYILLKRKTWNNIEFNCQYDGVVYAVFVSLGFALWENINYVLTYGFSTAIIRALTAIPGHACFGVFMGVFYGIARKHMIYGHYVRSKIARFFSVLIPMLLHGTYDFIAAMQYELGEWYFVAFILILFIVSYGLVNYSSKNDRYFG